MNKNNNLHGWTVTGWDENRVELYNEKSNSKKTIRHNKLYKYLLSLAFRRGREHLLAELKVLLEI